MRMKLGHSPLLILLRNVNSAHSLGYAIQHNRLNCGRGDLPCKNCSRPLKEIEIKDEKCIECGQEITYYNEEENFWQKIIIKIKKKAQLIYFTFWLP